MKFQPKTKDELKNLLPAGDYDGYVARAEEKQSANGNPMIVLDIEFYDEMGRSRFVTDRLILMEKTMFKILNFCECAGLMEQYNSGDLKAEDCQGKAVTCKVVVKNDENFGDKNEVKKYVVKKEKPAPVSRKAEPNRKAATPIQDDSSIPF